MEKTDNEKSTSLEKYDSWYDRFVVYLLRRNYFSLIRLLKQERRGWEFYVKNNQQLLFDEEPYKNKHWYEKLEEIKKHRSFLITYLINLMFLNVKKL